MHTFFACLESRDRLTIRRALFITQVALCALLTPLLDACGGADYRPYPYFDRVEVVAASEPADMPLGKSKQDIAREAPKAAAYDVAAMGGLGVGLSLICGPAFAACASVIVPVVAGPSLVTAPVNAGVAVLAGMSEEEKQQINDYFETLPMRRDLNKELVNAVLAILPGSRFATAGGDARLILGIRQIQIFHEVNHKFALFFMFEANMEWDLGKREQNKAQRTYNCLTEYETPNTWLAGSGRKLDEAINLCLNQVSQQIHTAIMKKSGDARA